MHYNVTVIITAMIRCDHANGATMSNAASSVDSARANESVGVLRRKSRKNKSEQQSGNEKFHWDYSRETEGNAQASHWRVSTIIKATGQWVSNEAR
jgi:hypothetical protein